MTIEVVVTCPLGSKCEEIKDNKIHRCAWSIEIAGQNPQTGEQTNDRGCAMAWTPILLVDGTRQSLGIAASIQSFRNEMVKANEASVQVLAAAARFPNLPNLPNVIESR